MASSIAAFASVWSKPDCGDLASKSGGLLRRLASEHFGGAGARWRTGVRVHRLDGSKRT
jgi:hypothetical protein